MQGGCRECDRRKTILPLGAVIGHCNLKVAVHASRHLRQAKDYPPQPILLACFCFLELGFGPRVVYNAAMRRLALLCALSVAGRAFASFEMALLLQSYDPADGPMGLHITRWDPVNHINLGQFVVTDAFSSSELALNTAAPGTVDLIQGDGGFLTARRYNYSTGIFVSVLNTGVSVNSIAAARYVGSNLLVAGNYGGTQQVRLYSTAGTLLRGYAMPVATLEAEDAITTASGVTFVLSRQAGTSSGSKYTLTSYAAGSGAIAQSAILLDNTTQTLHSLVVTDTHVGAASSSLANRRFVSYSGTTLGTVGSPGGYLVETDSLAQGHGDFVWGFGIDAAQTKMYFSTARLAQFNSSYWETSSVDYGAIYDSTMVLAPEPGTMAALGLGLVALLRRRKKA